MHYTTALNASKKENDTNCRFETFYACAVIVTLQFAKTTLLVWHYFWRKEMGPILFGHTSYSSLYKHVHKDLILQQKALWLLVIGRKETN